MNRIRKVLYYYRDLAPPLLAPLAVKYFLKKELTEAVLIKKEIFGALVERFARDLTNDEPLSTDALQQALEGPLQKIGVAADRVDRLVWIVKQAIDALWPSAYAVSNRTPVRAADRQFWSLGNALMPFTPTSLATLIKVRQCGLCGCWVRQGKEECPFCFILAPRGKATRAWERQQIHLQQPPAAGGSPRPPLVLPNDLRWDNPEGAGLEPVDDIAEEIGEPDFDPDVNGIEDGGDAGGPEEQEE